MRRVSILALPVLALLACLPPLLADLSRARAERNLERRARLALENASGQVKLASKSYGAGNWAATQSALEEVLESVELASESLAAAVKNPRNSRSYKNLEVRTREILKHLGALDERMSFDERQKVEEIVERIRKLHDDALWAVMGGSPGRGSK